MSQIKIRKANSGDVSGILILIRELAEYEHGLNEVTVTEEDLLRDGFGNNKLFECIVAMSENEIVGTAIYYNTYSTWNGRCLYLEDLIVKSNIRAQGIGSALMKEVVEIAKKKGAKRLAWQVLNWNVDALDFYKKIGASLNNEWLNGRFNEQQIKAFKQ